MPFIRALELCRTAERFFLFSSVSPFLVSPRPRIAWAAVRLQYERVCRTRNESNDVKLRLQESFNAFFVIGTNRRRPGTSDFQLRYGWPCSLLFYQTEFSLFFVKRKLSSIHRCKDPPAAQ
jgi:hypothetical protein